MLYSPGFSARFKEHVLQWATERQLPQSTILSFTLVTRRGLAISARRIRARKASEEVVLVGVDERLYFVDPEEISHLIVDVAEKAEDRRRKRPVGFSIAQVMESPADEDR